MKHLFKTLFLAFFVLSVYSCDAAQSKTATAKTVTEASAKTTSKASAKTVSKAKVEVYYFHFTRRCLTCNAVEAETKKTLEAMYSDRLKAGTITFVGVNLDEAAGKALGEKVGVAGQSLLIVGGGKKVDLTEQGFMYARTSPEKLKAAIKSTIDPLIN